MDQKQNASFWGCVIGKNKWSDFIKPQESDNQEENSLINKPSKEMKDKKIANIVNNHNVYKKKYKKNSSFVILSSNQKPKGVDSPLTSPNFKYGQDKINLKQVQKRSDIIHLYDNNLKHKKAVLLPASKFKIPPKYNNQKILDEIYVNLIKIKSENKKEKNFDEKVTTEEKKNSKITKLSLKVKSLENQILSLENTAKKMDKEVLSVKKTSLTSKCGIKNKNLQIKKSIDMISNRESYSCPLQKRTGMYKTKFNSNTSTRKKFRNKLSSKDLLNRFTPRPCAKLHFNDKLKENYIILPRDKDELTKNFKIMFESKIKENKFNRDHLKFSNLSNSETNNILSNTKENNFPDNEEKVLFNKDTIIGADLKYNKSNNGGKETLINSDMEELQHNQNKCHSNTDYSHKVENSVDLTNKIDSDNVYSQEVIEDLFNERKLGLSNDGYSKNMFVNINGTNHNHTNCKYSTQQKNLMNCKPNSFCKELDSGYDNVILNEIKCGPITVLNNTTHEVGLNAQIVKHDQVDCTEIEKPETAVNITIFINENVKDIKERRIIGKYKNVSLTGGSTSNNHYSSFSLDTQNFKSSSERNCQMKNKNVESKQMGCYKPVSCPGYLNQMKSKMLNNTNFNYDCTKMKTDKLHKANRNKLYLYRDQREEFQKSSKLNKQQMQFGDFIRKELNSLSCDKNENGDKRNSFINSIEGNLRLNYEDTKKVQGNELKVEKINKFYCITNDKDIGDTLNSNKNSMQCSMALGKTPPYIKKPMNSYNKFRTGSSLVEYNNIRREINKNLVNGQKNIYNVNSVLCNRNKITNVNEKGYLCSSRTEKHKLKPKYFGLFDINKNSIYKKKYKVSIEDLKNYSICNRFVNKIESKQQLLNNSLDKDFKYYSKIILSHDEKQDNHNDKNYCSKKNCVSGCKMTRVYKKNSVASNDDLKNNLICKGFIKHIESKKNLENELGQSQENKSKKIFSQDENLNKFNNTTKYFEPSDFGKTDNIVEKSLPEEKNYNELANNGILNISKHSINEYNREKNNFISTEPLLVKKCNNELKINSKNDEYLRKYEDNASGKSKYKSYEIVKNVLNNDKANNIAYNFMIRSVMDNKSKTNSRTEENIEKQNSDCQKNLGEESNNTNKNNSFSRNKSPSPLLCKKESNNKYALNISKVREYIKNTPNLIGLEFFKYLKISPSDENLKLPNSDTEKGISEELIGSPSHSVGANINEWQKSFRNLPKNDNDLEQITTSFSRILLCRKKSCSSDKISLSAKHSTKSLTKCSNVEKELEFKRKNDYIPISDSCLSIEFNHNNYTPYKLEQIHSCRSRSNSRSNINKNKSKSLICFPKVFETSSSSEASSHSIVDNQENHVKSYFSNYLNDLQKNVLLMNSSCGDSLTQFEMMLNIYETALKFCPYSSNGSSQVQ